MKLFFCLVLFVSSVFAAVEDEAKLFSQTAVANANKKFAGIKEKTGKEVLFLTVKDLQGKPLAAYMRSEAMKRKPNGTIILLSVQPPQFEIASGRQTGLVVTGERKAALKEMISKKLRKAPDATLGEVADYFVKLYKDVVPELIVADSYELPAPAAEPSQGLASGLKWILSGISLLLLILFGAFSLRPMDR